MTDIIEAAMERHRESTAPVLRNEVTATQLAAAERVRKWDLRYMELARLIATWSKDPSTRVGAVAVRLNNTIASTGFNGFAPGADDSPHLYADREYKYANVIHAEDNALRRCSDEDSTGGTLYSSFPCCPSCMAKIAQRGFLRVVMPPLPTEGRDHAWIRQWQSYVAESKWVAARAGIVVVER